MVDRANNLYLCFKAHLPPSCLVGVRIIKIIVCDDNKIFVDMLTEKLHKICSQKQIAINIENFIEGEKLLKFLETVQFNADICFLDIDMPIINGFDIADAIKKNNSNLIIVFISNFQEFVYDSFKYKPFWFIPKHSLDEYLEKVIISALDELNSKSKYYILKVKDEVGFKKIRIPQEHIQIIEIISRRIYLKTIDNTYLLSIKKLMDVASMLNSNNFIQINRGCLVNLAHIKSIDSDKVTLESGDIKYISRNRKKEVLSSFTKYMTNL